MSVLRSDQLIDQAERLSMRPPAGAPRQVDLRRAISAAYYAVFHATLTAAADSVIGATRRLSPEYGLAYRSLDHRALRSLCEDISRSSVPTKYGPYLPSGGFGAEIVGFAAGAAELQERRHAADYDPTLRVKMSDARLAIQTARVAISRFSAAAPDQRRAFLSLLIFPPRRS